MVDNTQFFVIGSSRSGTTLLRLILAGHSRLHIPPETWFIRPLVAQFSLTEILSREDIAKVVDVITADRRWRDMGMDAEDFRQQAEALAQPKLADCIDLVYRKQLESSGKQRCGDKTPNYFNLVPELSTLYPGAKFIHLIRDGRDVAISFIDVNWERYYDRKNFEWTQAMRYRRRYSKSSYAAQILDVRYEDLVSATERTVREICAFIGEEFEPTMLAWQQMRELVPAREMNIHGKLDKPISNDAIGVWRKKLSAFECFLIEACLHADLDRLNYPLRFSGVVWRPFLSVAGLLMVGLAPFLTRGVPYLQRRNYLPRTIYL